MHLAPPHRLLASALASASLIITGFVLPGAVPTAAGASCGTTNIALNKTATASSLEKATFPASAAVDGNTGTRWSSAFSDPQWLEVDLGSSQSICQVTLHWEAAYATAFQIQTSADNSTWTTIYSTTTGTGGTQTLSVTGTGRYIRMYGTARGLLFDAGTTNSNALLTISTSGSNASHASNPISVQDTFFRIGGDIAGQATNSLIVNANNTLVDDIWAWRADHGNSGTVGWTVNTAAHGLVVNGSNVLATGLFVEHYQNYDVQWNGNGGETIFFQNEMPYDPPNQAAWMNGSSDGYAAYEVAPSVTTHQAYGMGSYCYFNVNPAVVADHAFEAPDTPGVQFHDILTVSLGGVGVIEHVINSTGGPTPSNTTPVDVTSYP